MQIQVHIVHGLIDVSDSRGGIMVSGENGSGEKFYGTQSRGKTLGV